MAGSVFAAAVILPPDFHHPLLNDSKQMTERRRDQLREIIEREAIAWHVAEVKAERIDQINILNASIEGMNLALKALATTPEFIVVDGNRFKTDLDIPYRTIVKGDGKYANIAAASVLAKTHRDEAMMSSKDTFDLIVALELTGYLDNLSDLLQGVKSHRRQTSVKSFLATAPKGMRVWQQRRFPHIRPL